MSKICVAKPSLHQQKEHTYLFYDGTNDKEVADYMEMPKYRRRDNLKLWLSNGTTTYVGITPDSYIVDKCQVLSPVKFHQQYEEQS